MSQGQKMVWAAEFVRALNEMEQFRPRIEVGEKYDDFEKRVEEWDGSGRTTSCGRADRTGLLDERIPRVPEDLYFPCHRSP